MLVPAVLIGRLLLALLECVRKALRIIEADRLGDDFHGPIRLQQQFLRLTDADAGQVFFRADVHFLFEDPVQIRAVDRERIGNVADLDRGIIVVAHDLQRLGEQFVRAGLGGCFGRERLAQVKKDFHQTCIQQQVVVLGNEGDFDHLADFFLDQIAAVFDAEDRVFHRYCRAREVFCNQGTFEADPIIRPGVLFIRFVADDGLRFDEEEIAFFQLVTLAAAPEGAAAGMDIVQHITTSGGGAVCVPGLSFLVADRVKEHVVIVIMIIEEIAHPHSPFHKTR